MKLFLTGLAAGAAITLATVAAIIAKQNQYLDEFDEDDEDKEVFDNVDTESDFKPDPEENEGVASDPVTDKYYNK